MPQEVQAVLAALDPLVITLLLVIHLIQLKILNGQTEVAGLGDNRASKQFLDQHPGLCFIADFHNIL